MLHYFLNCACASPPIFVATNSTCPLPADLILAEERRYEEGLTLLKRGLQLLPKRFVFFSHPLFSPVCRPQLLKRLAERYNTLSKSTLALGALEEAAKVAPGDGFLLFELGKAFAGINQLCAPHRSRSASLSLPPDELLFMQLKQLITFASLRGSSLQRPPCGSPSPQCWCASSGCVQCLLTPHSSPES